MTIPETAPRRATAGERLTFNVLKRCLPDNCIIYYEPFVQGKKPDLVIIYPPYGILVLEIKDYKKSTILSMDVEKWTLQLPTGDTGQVRNPLDQARSYAFSISDKLRKDPCLLVSSGVHKLKFSYGFGVVMPKMSRVDAITMGVEEFIPNNLLLCKEDLSESEDQEAVVVDAISSMFAIRTANMTGLEDKDIDRVRYALFPEVRLGEQRAYNEENLLKFRDLTSMTLYQESLAKQTGEGHRLLRGVSGSGKTLVLVARAKLQARENPEWKILIVCYAVVLSKYIRHLISPELYPNIEVMTFHEFVRGIFGSVTPMQIGKLSREPNHIFPVYESINIDEGQDFEADWLRLLSKCLSKETNSLTIAEDRAQSIFKRKTSLASATGLDFRGRSRVLTINYRNTRKVLQLAWRFFSRFSQSLPDSTDIIHPKATSREGKLPLLMGFSTVDQEASWVAGEILRLIATGENPGDIAILYRVKQYNNIRYLDILTGKLASLGISMSWVSRTRESKASYVPDPERVNILTLDSSKGLDFKTVFIINCQNSPLSIEEDKDREASLMYIGMTRAIEMLYLTWSGVSEYTEYFEEHNKSVLKVTVSNHFKGVDRIEK